MVVSNISPNSLLLGFNPCCLQSALAGMLDNRLSGCLSLVSVLGKRSNLTVRIAFNWVGKFKHHSAERGMVPKRALLQKSDFGPALSLATVLKT